MGCTACLYTLPSTVGGWQGDAYKECATASGELPQALSMIPKIIKIIPFFVVAKYFTICSPQAMKSIYRHKYLGYALLYNRYKDMTHILLIRYMIL